MKGDDLREALRPSGNVDPLDPAKAIAGAHRRRRRGIATVGASAVAVLAVVAVGVVVGIRPTGGPVIDQPAAPSTSTPAVPPSTPNTPQPVDAPTPGRAVEPPSKPPGTPPGVPPEAPTPTGSARS